jgi:hypothetical protein
MHTLITPKSLVPSIPPIVSRLASGGLDPVLAPRLVVNHSETARENIAAHAMMSAAPQAFTGLGHAPLIQCPGTLLA